MENKLKIGVVGCGGIARVAHLPAYSHMDNAEIVAFCDIIPERAEYLRDNFFPNAKVYTDFHQLIADPAVESVDICTPNYLHSVIAVAALEAGKHVFSEKPDAINVEEALKMQKAAETSGKTLMVMRNNRFEGCSQYLKKYIEEGKMGDIYCGRCGWIRTRGIPGKGGWFTTKAQSGGGPLIDLGVHMIDLAIWLMGNPKPVAVSGATFNKFTEDTSKDESEHAQFGDKVEGGTFDVEDLAMGFIKFDNGACLQIEFSWASNIEAEKTFVELRGDKAGASWENWSARIFHEEGGQMVAEPALLPQPAGGHEMCLRHYVDVVLNGATPCFVPEQGVNMIKILTAIYESAKTGREVRL